MTDVSYRLYHLKPFNIDSCKIELFEIKLLDRLIVCKQMANV